MSVNNLPPPIFITRPNPLRRLVKTLLHQPLIAVDTESNSLHAYREQVCLIQFSIPGADYLVDPLVLDDLSPLGEVFSEPGIQKVFHAAEYDLICLKRDFGFEFNNIFDTMIAARILGRNEIGLGALLEVEFGVKMDKRNQRANWGQRPLPVYLTAYAQLDTHFLIELRSRLFAELVDSELLGLALEDFSRICRVCCPANNHRRGDWWHIAGAHELPPQKAAVLAELCRYRHEVASSLNRPLFKVMGDRTLLAIAWECPTRVNQLAGLPGLSSLQIERYGKALISAVQRGLRAEPLYLPHHMRPDDGYLTRLDRLRAWRKAAASRLGVGSDVVLPRDLLHEIAERNPLEAEELAEILREVPWRLERYGKQILEVLRAIIPERAV